MNRLLIYTFIFLGLFKNSYAQIGAEFGLGFTSISENTPKMFSSQKNIETLSIAAVYNYEQSFFIGLGTYQKKYSFDSLNNKSIGLFIPLQLQVPIKIYHNRQIGRRCRYATFDIMLGNDFTFDISQSFSGSMTSKTFKNYGKYGLGFSYGSNKFLMYTAIQSMFSYGKNHTINMIPSKEKGIRALIGFSITPTYDFRKM